MSVSEDIKSVLQSLADEARETVSRKALGPDDRLHLNSKAEQYSLISKALGTKTAFLCDEQVKVLKMAVSESVTRNNGRASGYAATQIATWILAS